MNQYKITLEGATPIIFHRDNIQFAEKVTAWRNDPQNREIAGKPGDDRGPAWTWIGGLYHDAGGHKLIVASDNLMTMLREGGAKVKKGARETYKRQTQSGVLVDGEGFRLIGPKGEVPFDDIKALIGNNDFTRHSEVAESLGFELMVVRARVTGSTKHVRVRAMFRQWKAVGTITVIDEEMSGITRHVLEQILTQAGALCGLGDWRPSAPKSPGTYGRFVATIE